MFLVVEINQIKIHPQACFFHIWHRKANARQHCVETGTLKEDSATQPSKRIRLLCIVALFDTWHIKLMRVQLKTKKNTNSNTKTNEKMAVRRKEGIVQQTNS